MDLDFVAFVFLTRLGDLIFANSFISSPNDITSTIATWATVAVALGGVAGPLLVCRASRTAGNVAITALDAGTAENGGFISKGFRFRLGIRLLRRVNAPTLSKTPRYTEWTISLEECREACPPSRLLQDKTWAPLGGTDGRG
jgi:hypothetical protein